MPHQRKDPNNDEWREDFSDALLTALSITTTRGCWCGCGSILVVVPPFFVLDSLAMRNDETLEGRWSAVTVDESVEHKEARSDAEEEDEPAITRTPVCDGGKTPEDAIMGLPGNRSSASQPDEASSTTETDKRRGAISAAITHCWNMLCSTLCPAFWWTRDSSKLVANVPMVMLSILMTAAIFVGNPDGLFCWLFSQARCVCISLLVDERRCPWLWESTSIRWIVAVHSSIGGTGVVTPTETRACSNPSDDFLRSPTCS